MITSALHAPLIVGCDISKQHIDCYLDAPGTHVRITNNPAGWSRFVTLVPAGSIVAMEATGAFYQLFAASVFEHGCTVFVVNPWQIKAFGDAGLSRVKTDRVDARLIAEFCRVMQPQLWEWRPSPDALTALTALVRLGDGLLRHRVAAGNRVGALVATNSRVAVEAEAVHQTLKDERERLMLSAISVAESCELVGKWYLALQELPGLGRVAALKVLAYSGDIRRFKSGRHYASFTGLTPRVSESGDSARRSMISRRGSVALRSTLYWAAMSASNSKGQQGQFYRAMLARGKRPKIALVAVANRLARAVWQVVNADRLTS